MPQSPHRRRLGSTASADQQHRVPNLKSSTTSRTHPVGPFNNSHDDNNDNHSIAASEDSNPIIWEDDAGTDLRHLFTRRGDDPNSDNNGGELKLLPTMTQQVDEMMLHMEDSDDSDHDSSDDRNDMSKKNINDKKGHVKGNDSKSKNYTPPPAAATRSKKQKLALLDSGDVPATISKVKRRRRWCNTTATNNNGGHERTTDDDRSDTVDHLSSNNKNVIEEEAARAATAVVVADNKDNDCKLKLSAKQEVDRVFDLLGLPPDTNSLKQDDHPPSDTRKDESKQQQQRVLSSQTSFTFNGIIHNNNSSSRSHNHSLSTQSNENEHLKGRRLTFMDNKRHQGSGFGGTTANIHMNIEQDDDDGVENLLKEIEQGLDQVCSSNKKGGGDSAAATRGENSGSCSQAAGAAAVTSTTNNSHSASGTNIVCKEKKIGSSFSSSTFIQPFGIKNANAINAQQQSTATSTSHRDTAKNGMELLSRNNCSNNSSISNNTSTKTASTVPPCPPPVVPTSNNDVKNEADNASYDFDNDDEEEYMRGLGGDATLSSASSKGCSINNSSTPVAAAPAAASSAMPCPPPSAAAITTSSLSNNQVAAKASDGNYDFLDDVNDDELANYEFSGTQQCHADKEPTTNTEEAEDDIAFDDEIDFNALDKQVEQRLEKIGGLDADLAVPPPPPNAPIHNRRCGHNLNHPKEPLFLSFTRYVVRRVKNDFNTYTKTMDVSLWTPSEDNCREDETERLKKMCSTNDVSTNVSIDGCIHLRGEWYHTNAKSGDVIHLCSISGAYLTDVTALPVILHSNPPVGSDIQDDLVLVIHPDELITPTLVSEAVKCPRLATLQSRLGSTGLSAKSAVMGTLRHDLFERCLREKDTSRRSAALFTRDIVRKNAEALVGCGITDRKEAFGEVMKTLPQIQSFLDMYTSWNATKKGQGVASTKHGGALLKGMFPPYDAFLSVDGVFATEEWALVPELGLKGNVDATVLGRIKPVISSTAPNADNVEQDALVPVELKTGHNQNPQHNHLAQLSVYTIMLRARHGSASNGDTGLHGEASNLIERGAASSGMLLYLNDKSFCAKHIKPSLSDIKTLIGQRNGIVCDVLDAARPRGIALEYQEGNKRSKVVVNDPPPSALPPLLSNTSTCERCYKNRECMMYTAADNAANISSTNAPRTNLPHRQLIDHFTGHLKGTDLDYFRKWDRLIDLERHASPSDIAKSWLYNSDEKERKDGRCISSMILDETHLSATLVKKNDSDIDGDAVIRFCRSSENKSKQPIANLHFEKGTYVIIRTDDASFSTRRMQQPGTKCNSKRRRILIFRGSVSSVGESNIDVVLQQKDVSRLSSSSMFRIDRDELSNGAGLLLQNLVNFFTLDIPSFSTEALGQTPLKMKQLTQNTDSSARRRRLTNSIIRLEPPPRFSAVSEEGLFSEDISFNDLVSGCDKSGLKRDFAKLNSDQKAAVLKVISAEDFALIQGLPGTGKSATIVFLTRLLVARGKRVLLTSYTHSAVDNLLCKLIGSGVNSSDLVPNPIVRIGRDSHVYHSNVHQLLAQNIALDAERQESNKFSSTCTKPNADALFNVVTSARVVGVSALTAPRSSLLAGQKFDVVIVDEAGQISQPAILGAIMAADSFVLVGDHMQLPPLVVSEVADQAGYGESMLLHLAEGFPDAVAKLTMQYRMNEDICHFSNVVAYKGLLKCGNDEVKNQKLCLPATPKQQTDPGMKWIERIVNPNCPVVFLDCTAKESQGPVNAAEISLVEQCVKALSGCDLSLTSIGVITPFRSQLRALKDSLNLMSNSGLELSTIDRFQGRDKSVVIISLVRSNDEGKSGRLLQDFRRLNVAFSRAKHKMIIIGSYSTLHRGSDVLRPVLESCRERGWVQNVPEAPMSSNA